MGRRHFASENQSSLTIVNRERSLTHHGNQSSFIDLVIIDFCDLPV